MISFAGKSLGETGAHKVNMTINQNGRDYSTGADCVCHEEACSVWFIPQDYTNEQWDSMLLAEKGPTGGALLAKYPKKETRQENDLKNYSKQYDGKGSTLIPRGPNKNSTGVYGSDCYTVLSKKEVELIVKRDALTTYLKGAAIFPENDILQNINIQNYGAGNFYFKLTGVNPGLHRQNVNKERTYQ